MACLAAIDCSSGTSGGDGSSDTGGFPGDNPFGGSGGSSSGGSLGSGAIVGGGGYVGGGGSLATGGSVGVSGAAGGLSAAGADSGTGSGGAVSTGGISGSGGAVGSGGAIASGGTVGNGGTASSGGAIGSGGTVSSGGAIGSGGTVSSGGAIGSGGTVSSGGTVGSGGTVSSGGNVGSGGTTGTGSDPTMLPTAKGTCPAMSNLNGTAVTFAGQPVTIWSGDPSNGPGPLLIYWYATGSNANEPKNTIGAAQIAKFTSMGGVVAAQNTTTGAGNTTGNGVWYTGDAPIADEIVACSIKNQKISPRRIHSAGYSAGGLQTVYMYYARSGYIASVLTYSGGSVGINAPALQDPSNVPAAIATHGAQGKDIFGSTQVDFYNFSHTWETAVRGKNGFIIDCNDGGTHTDIVNRAKIAPQAIQFFLDHPFKVAPEPYAGGLPSGFPSYCTIVP